MLNEMIVINLLHNNHNHQLFLLHSGAIVKLVTFIGPTGAFPNGKSCKIIDCTSHRAQIRSDAVLSESQVPVLTACGHLADFLLLSKRNVLEDCAARVHH